MRKVSASDWIRRSAEYPADDHLTMAPPRVRTLRARRNRAKQEEAEKDLPPVALLAGKAASLPPVAAAAGMAVAEPAIARGEVGPVREPKLPPVAAAAGRAAREKETAVDLTADADDTKAPRVARAPAERELPPAGSRMQAFIEPAPAVQRPSRPQFEPLPVQLPSHELVSKVTRQRSNQPQRSRPRGTIAAELFSFCVLLAGIAYALIAGGHFAERGSMRGLVNQASALIGLSAENVQIIGLEKNTREQVLTAIGVEENGTLIGFDAGKARNTLESLDWVSRASVQRLFPNRLLVEITERHPFALWQHDGTFQVIDKEGIPMPSLNIKAYRHLPIVVGEGANVAAADLVNHLEAQPEIISMVRAAVRVADRRWVLYLKNTIKVDLPEKDVDEALGMLVTLTDRYGVMSRDITRIDMRLNDRVVVTLSDEAVEKLNQTKSAKPVRVSRSN